MRDSREYLQKQVLVILELDSKIPFNLSLSTLNPLTPRLLRDNLCTNGCHSNLRCGSWKENLKDKLGMRKYVLNIKDPRLIS